MKRVRYILTALLLTLLVASCTPSVWHGNANNPRAIVLGDSITALSKEEIVDELSPSYYISVSATSGYTSTQVYMSTASYEKNVAAVGVVVWNAGMNDYGNVDIGQTFNNMRAARDHLGAKCFFASTLSTTTGQPARNDWNAWFNFYLVFGGEFQVLDFGGFANANPQYFPDSVHPDEAAQWIYAGMIKATADSCYG